MRPPARHYNRPSARSGEGTLDGLHSGPVQSGVGSRPEEYERAGAEWGRRGRLQDELLETLLAAWSGEPFPYRGRTVRVTLRPYTRPHPVLLVGGSSRAAARLGLPLFPSAHLPELEAYYREQCAAHGTEGFCMMPAERTPLLHVSEDPERTWALYGGHLLHEARTYAPWQSKDIRSAVRSAATTVAELREEGVYRIVTPDELAGLAAESLVLHPLCGGMPVEEGWRSLRLFCGAIARKRHRPGSGERGATPPNGPRRGWVARGRCREEGAAGISPSPQAFCPWSPSRT
ncbi:LLM class flavin-dependent oxidoreductase [Streptomyces globisporus]|uniref:LLM class flavin-dependent oxidoreductase n=1 Tax=Streptomyces globisporus TaxID=1908 RepID=UPI003637AF44